MKKIYAVWLARVILAAVFFMACIPKIIDPEAFSLAVFRYQMLPDAAINLLALFLPWLELVTGLALLFSHRLRPAASAIIFMMLLVFTAALTINIFRGISTACGCFSVKSDAAHAGWLNVIRNSGLLLLTGFIFWDAWKDR